MAELAQDTFLVTEDKKDTAKKVVTKKPQKKIPTGYIKIDLDSIGKLTAPKSLHFRNYSLEEVTDLATSPDEDFVGTIIGCLNSMVHEGFDCAFLHENDLIKIMLTIYTNFWHKELKGYPYLLDEDGEQVDDNRAYARFEATAIKTSPIAKDFEEPFNITINDRTVSFRFQRIGDIYEAQRFIENEFVHENARFSDLEATLAENERLPDAEKVAIDFDELEEYREVVRDKEKLFLKVVMAQRVVKIGSKKLDTLAKQLKEYTNVGAEFWRAYQEVQQTYEVFGVNPEVTFFSPELGEEVTRRFQFRPSDFLPDMEPETSGGFKVSFG